MKLISSTQLKKARLLSMADFYWYITYEISNDLTKESIGMYHGKVSYVLGYGLELPI